MDSRRFCLLMDDLARTWRDKKAKDEDKEFRLAALMLFIEDKDADAEDARVRRAAPAKRAADLPYEEPAGSEAMTAEEVERYARLADEAAASNVPQEQVIGEVIEGVVKPSVQRGFRTVAVPLRWRGRAVSMNHDRWLSCLKQHGVYANAVEWAHDIRSWQGPPPVPGESVPLVLA
jgi:hypothetical protein